MDEQQAKLDGAAAFRAGLGPEDNPHIVSSRIQRAWFAGFYDAEADEMVPGAPPDWDTGPTGKVFFEN